MPMPASTNFYSDSVYQRLIARYQDTAREETGQRWQLLEAAHIVGQKRFGPHLEVHFLMLSLAWEQRQPKEVLGQLFRIALVPLGHLFKRLPLGNPGRANVSAFKPMQPTTEILEVIAESRAGSFPR